MKFNVVIVDLEVPPRVRKWGLRLGIPIAVLLGGGAVAYAAGLVTWTSGQTLTAADLNNNFSQLQSQLSSLTPSGTVIAYAGETVPTGWLPCDGAAVSRTTYANLFAAIKTIHGGGDGVTTFNVPDYRGRFLRGMDADAGRDPGSATRTAPQAGVSTVTGGAGNSGDNVGSIEAWATGLPATSFTTSSAGAHNHGGATGTESNQNIYSNSQAPNCVNPGSCGSNFLGETSLGATHTHPISTDGAHTHTVTGGGDAETRPTNAYVQFIIKT